MQVLGLRGVRHAADGVGGMLGLAPNGLDTLDAVPLDDAVRRRTGYRNRTSEGACIRSGADELLYPDDPKVDRKLAR